MAKVQGPLFSMGASGSFGGALVFATWKGINYVRELVIPSNPQSAGQESARNDIRTTAGIVRQVYRNLQTRVGEALTDLQLLRNASPADITWANYFTQVAKGPNGATLDATEAQYAALTQAQQDSWAAAAASMQPPMQEVAQTAAGGVFVTNKTAGELLFTHIRTMNILGIAPFDPINPPSYA